MVSDIFDILIVSLVFNGYTISPPGDKSFESDPYVILSIVIHDSNV